jgi:hypothetical protein
MAPWTVGGAEPLRKSSMSQSAFAPNASLPHAGTEVEDDYDMRVPHVSDYEGRKGERMEEREGQCGHFACLADLDTSWPVELACHASKCGNSVCIFSLMC